MVVSASRISVFIWPLKISFRCPGVCYRVRATNRILTRKTVEERLNFAVHDCVCAQDLVFAHSATASWVHKKRTIIRLFALTENYRGLHKIDHKHLLWKIYTFVPKIHFSARLIKLKISYVIFCARANKDNFLLKFSQSCSKTWIWITWATIVIAQRKRKTTFRDVCWN